MPVISRLFGVPDSHKLDVYLQNDGYKGMERALKELTPEQVVDEVKKSNLRGRGGAGFPTGMKWSFVPKESAKPKYILCNADESEPGTCKDRPLMEMCPHQLIEGIIIAGRAVGAHRGYIYIRGEYRYVLDIVDAAIEEAYARGYLGKNILGSGFDFDLLTHTGAGAYECGEESALMESLEGKRGYPRIRPPFPAVVGLYGSPTVINNVETLSSVPDILRRGGEWYAGLGSPKNGGTRLFCISGHVNRPGIYELPMGFNLKRMIEDVAGGIPNGRKLKAVIPGGSSCPLLKADEIDMPDGFRFAGQGRIDAGLGRLGGDRRKTPAWWTWRGASCISTRTNRAAGAFPAAKAPAGCARCWTASTPAAGAREDIPLVGELGEEHAGQNVLPAGRRRGHAHHQHRQEVAQRIRGASRGQVPVPAGRSAGRRTQGNRQNMAETAEIKFKIDDRELSVPPGTLVIEAARRKASRCLRSATTRACRCRRPAACAWWKWKRRPSCKPRARWWR